VDKRFFVCGITGSGKTSYASKLFEQFEGYAIFVNTNAEIIPEEKAQVVITTFREFQAVLNDYKMLKKICVNPLPNAEIPLNTVEDIIKTCFILGQSINENTKEPKNWCAIFLDEVQDYSSKHSPNPNIDILFKRGRRYGVIGVAISQTPAQVSHNILRNCDYHVIFKVSPYERSYFEEYHIPVFENLETTEWLKREYHYVLFDGYQIYRKPPIVL